MKRYFLALLFMGTLAISEPPSPGEDPVLPGDGFTPDHYETLWTKSPFAVATADTAAAAESSDYSLVGVAQFDGICYASLIDKGSQEHFLVSSQKPVRGLTLVSVTQGRGSAETLAVMQRAGQSISLKLEQGPSVPNMAGNAPPQPNPYPAPQPYAGQPNGYPGQVGMPGQPGQPGMPPPHRRFRNIIVPPRPPPQQQPVPQNQPH